VDNSEELTTMTPTDEFRVDPQYLMAQLQKDNSELNQQLTLQRAGFEQLRGMHEHEAREHRRLAIQCEAQGAQLRDFQLFKDSLRSHGFEPDTFIGEMNNGNLGGTVLRVNKRATMIDAESDEE